MKKKSFLWKLVFYVLVTFIVGCISVFIIQNSFTIAPPGTTAAKVTLGTVSDTPYQGFFWRIPFCSNSVILNTKQQQNQYVSNNIKTKDAQTIGLNCMVIYQVNSEKVPEIVRNIAPEHLDSIVLFPRIANAVQETIGKNDVFLLITQQDMVREATKYILSDMLSIDNYVTIKDVLFSNPKFSPEFERAVEAKMREGQLLEIAKIQTLKVEEEAKQKWALMAVDLKALKLKNQVLTNPLIAKYEAVKALQKWKGDVPSTLLISGEGDMPIVPIVSGTGVKP